MSVPRLFVYRQSFDTGVAPHISENGILTLTLCKPQIRLQARDGDYVLALVGMSKNPRVVGNGPDRFFKVSYIFRVTEKVPMRAYQQWCQEHAPNKIPNNITFMGNCQYNSDLQWMPGPHGPHEAQRNTSGCYSIVSRAYGGWTFERPYTLTSEDMEMLGVPEDKVRSRGVGHATYTLSPAAVAHLEHLMKQAPLQPGPASAPLPPMTSKPCRGCRGGKRTRRLPSHQQRQRRAQTRRA